MSTLINVEDLEKKKYSEILGKQTHSSLPANTVWRLRLTKPASLDSAVRAPHGFFTHLTSMVQGKKERERVQGEEEGRKTKKEEKKVKKRGKEKGNGKGKVRRGMEV